MSIFGRHLCIPALSALLICSVEAAPISQPGKNPMEPVASDQIIDHPSPIGFAQTLDRITRTITAAGMTVFATVDHAAGAREAGLPMPPTVVLLYGNPKGGTPIMQATPQAALDLPLRVLLREDAAGRTWLSFHPVVPMLRQAGVPDALAARLEPAQRVLIDALKP